ncbi:hypothetical protein BTVI_62555 [Pitangus sulphuratus]|nr:hypothetical protein BTVI_62555 [Pitangus sulphuratus]
MVPMGSLFIGVDNAANDAFAADAFIKVDHRAEDIPCNFTDGTKLGQALCMLEVWASIQTELTNWINWQQGNK